MVISVRPWVVVLASRGGAFCVVHESAMETCTCGACVYVFCCHSVRVRVQMYFHLATNQ